MALLEVLGRVPKRRREKQQIAADTFGELVRQLANDEVVDESQIDAVLAATGRSVEDLSKAVELAKQRLAWHQRLSQEPERRRRLAEIEAECGASTAKVKKVTDAHKELGQRLYGEEQAIRQQLNLVDVAREKLRATRGEAIRAQERERTVGIQALMRRLNGLREQIRSGLGTRLSDEFKNRIRNQIGETEQEIKRLQSELTNLAGKSLEPRQ